MASSMESTDEIKNGKTDMDDETNLNHASPNCALCGCSTPAVRCDKCSSQIFCLSCDDMYHRHPKRRLHLRKAVDSIWNSHRSPRLRRHTNLPGDPSKIPIPPPRRKRRERYTISGTGLPKSAFEVPPFSTREPWATRRQNVKTNDVIADSFASDNSALPPLPKQQRSSMGQKYENSEAILLQNNGIDSQSGRTPDSEVGEHMMSEEQRQHDSVQSPSSPSQPLLVDMPDGRTFGPPGQMYSRGSHMSHSAADLRSGPFPASSPQPFFYPHPHPHLMHPQMHPFPHAVPHMNCPQCLTGSWSNVMSPHVPPFHHPWSSAQSTLLRRHAETVGDGHLRERQNSLPDAASYPGPHVPFPPAAFPYVGSPFYPHGYPPAESPLFMDSPQSTDQQRQTLKSPSSTSSRQSHATDKYEETSQVITQKIADEVKSQEEEKEVEEEAEEVEEEAEEAEEVAEEAEVEYKPPEKPVEPWTCVHCTFINPPGSHICMICCKTSYPSPLEETKKQKKKKKSEHDTSVSAATSQEKTDHVECTTEESMQVDSEQLTTVDSEKDLNANIVSGSTKEKIETEVDESDNKTKIDVPDTEAERDGSDDVIQKSELKSTVEVGEADHKIESRESEVLSPIEDSEAYHKIESRESEVLCPVESGVSGKKPEDTAIVETLSSLLSTETQTATSTTSTDVQTHKLECMSVASSTDSLFPYFQREMSVQTEIELAVERHSVATDPMISTHSMESLMSGVSAPPYHNRRAGMGRAGNSFSTQSLSAFERGRSRSPIPRPSSSYGEMASFGRGLNSVSQEPLPHSWNRSFWGPDPMFYKPYGLRHMGHGLREDYFDGTWGSMDRLNKDLKKKEEEKWKTDSVHKPRLHRSLTDLKSDRATDMPYLPEIEFLHTVKDAERHGYTIDDLQVAYFHCDKADPVRWLDDNWDVMIQNVISLAAKYGEDHEENDVGAISPSEAKEALRIHHGNLWDAVTECIEIRQRKILELTVRGNFTQKQIVEALKNNGGNVELAYADLIRATSRIFKHILSPGLSEESEDIAIQRPSTDETSDLDSVKKPLIASDKLLHAVSSTDELLNEEDRKTEAESKRSDFLTKLTAIRKAQSERRKAREEKELSLKVEKTPKADYLVPELEDNALDESIVSPHQEEPLPDKFVDLAAEHFIDKFAEHVESPASPLEDFELRRSASKSPPVKESADNIDLSREPEGKAPLRVPKDEEILEDYDSRWIDSQGEWIEEFSDEQWEEDEEEGRGEWVTVRTKYRKLEADLDEEAKQLASLWEHEELVDDVFEEEEERRKDIPEAVEMDSFATENTFEVDKKENWVKVEHSKPKYATLKVDSIESQPLNIESSLTKDTDFQDAPVIDEHEEKMKSILEPIEIDHFAKEDVFEIDKKEKWVKVDYSEPEKDISKVDALEKHVQNVELSYMKDTEHVDEMVLDKHAEEIQTSEINVSALTDIHDELQPHEDWVTVQTESTLGTDILYEGPITDDKTYEFGVQPAVATETVVQDSLSDECSEGEWEKVETQEQYLDSLRDNFLTSTDDEAQYLYKVSSEEEYRDESEAIESLSETEISPETINRCLEAALEDGTKALPLPPKRQKVNLPSVEPTPALKQQDTGLSDEKLQNDKLQENISAPEDSVLPQVPIRRRSRTNGMPAKEVVEKPVSDEMVTPITDASHLLSEQDNDEFLKVQSESLIGDSSSSKYFETLEASQSYAAEEEGSISTRTELPYDPSLSMYPEESIERQVTQQSFLGINDNKMPLVGAINFCSRTYNNVPAEDSLDLFAMEPEILDEPSILQERTDEFHTAGIQPILQLKEITSLQHAEVSEENLYFEECKQAAESVGSSHLVHEYLKTDETAVDVPSDAVSLQTEYVGAIDFQPSLYAPSPENQFTGTSLRETSMMSPEPEEEIPAFSEMEATSAAADYFFGRYNEVVVTRKGKKKPALQKNKMQSQVPTMAQSVSPSTPLQSKDMTRSTPTLKASSSVEGKVDFSVKPPVDSIKASVRELQPSVSSPSEDIVDKVEEKIKSSVLSPVTAKDKISAPASPTTAPSPPPPAEALSFAEDYFFGSYNEVVVQKKTKKRPTPFKSKGSFDKIQSVPKEPAPQSENKSVVDAHISAVEFRSRSGSDVHISTANLKGQLEQGAQEPPVERRQRSGSDVQVSSVEHVSQTLVTSASEQSRFQADEQCKTEVPSPKDASIASSQDAPRPIKGSLDEKQENVLNRGPPLLETKENKQGHLSNIQSETSLLNASGIIGKSPTDSKIKSVHFQDPEPPVVPPPRKLKKIEKSQQMSTPDQMHEQQPPVAQTYAAAEYLFGRYDEISAQKKATPQKSLQAKKKLPPYTEDFRIKPECEPTANLPQTPDTSLKKSDLESLLSSGTLQHDNVPPGVFNKFETVSKKNVGMISSTSDLSEDFSNEKNYLVEECNVPVESFQKHVETAHASDKMTYGELHECAAEKSFVSNEPIEPGDYSVSDSWRSSGESMGTASRETYDEQTPLTEMSISDSTVSCAKDIYFKPETFIDDSSIPARPKIHEKDISAPTEEIMEMHDDVTAQTVSDAIEDYEKVASLSVEDKNVHIRNVSFYNESIMEETCHDAGDKETETVASHDDVLEGTSPVENIDAYAQCEVMDQKSIGVMEGHEQVTSLSAEYESIHKGHVSSDSESTIEGPCQNKEDEVKLSLAMPHDATCISAIFNEFKISCEAVVQSSDEKKVGDAINKESIDSRHVESSTEAVDESSQEIATQLVSVDDPEFLCAPDSDDETIISVHKFVNKDIVPKAAEAKSNECIFPARRGCHLHFSYPSVQ